jgi:hypothetical protein
MFSFVSPGASLTLFVFFAAERPWRARSRRVHRLQKVRFDGLAGVVAHDAVDADRGALEIGGDQGGDDAQLGSILISAVCQTPP